MKRSLKREVDEMGDLESPGDHRSPKQAVGIRSFPEADWMWSTPSSGKKRGRPTGARIPVPKVKWMGGRDGGATAICASG